MTPRSYGVGSRRGTVADANIMIIMVTVTRGERETRIDVGANARGALHLRLMKH